MKRNLPASFLLSALIAVPVSSPNGWRTFGFDKTSTNRVTFATQGVTIDVAGSTSVSLFPLPGATLVKRLQVTGEVLGFPSLRGNEKEGVGSNDDFALRIGLVFAGGRHLNWWENWQAPHWLRDIAALAPDGGLGKIHFYEIAQRLAKGTRRTISKRWKLDSTIALQQNVPGPFSYDVPVEETESCLGLWLQADGDNTDSTFQIVVRKVVLEN